MQKLLQETLLIGDFLQSDLIYLDIIKILLECRWSRVCSVQKILGSTYIGEYSEKYPQLLTDFSHQKLLAKIAPINEGY